MKGKKKMPVTFIVVSVIFTIYLLILLIPYLYAMFASVSDYKEYYFSIFPFPKGGLKLYNFADAWNNLQHEGTGVPAMILNSLWFAGGPAVLGVLFSSFRAYICS